MVAEDFVICGGFGQEITFPELEEEEPDDELLEEDEELDELLDEEPELDDELDEEELEFV